MQTRYIIFVRHNDDIVCTLCRGEGLRHVEISIGAALMELGNLILFRKQF